MKKWIVVDDVNAVEMEEMVIVVGKRFEGI